jgi:hypothetical protein
MKTEQAGPKNCEVQNKREFGESRNAREKEIVKIGQHK